MLPIAADAPASDDVIAYAGPSGKPLQATYKHVDGLAFQDEVGALILQCCQTVPFGVLVFCSSYSMIDKLKTRWVVTGLWSQLQGVKEVLVEPRATEKSEFESILNTFYRAVEGGQKPGVTGALFFAVARGKVSEGLDFSDNNARAVISLGIPFPSLADQQVAEKRKFNDSRAKTMGVLTGSRWYESQAFRALNQGLGRCIRHRNDWGALLIVDGQ